MKDSIAHSILGDFIEDDFGNEYLDWEYEIDWADETLDELYYQGDMAIKGRELDIRQLNYEYKWIDWQKAAQQGYKGNRADLIMKDEVNIYPDTLCWIRDFAYAHNEPYTRNYFSHPAYDDYPVVGVSWKQAKAFCDWRTLSLIHI